MLKFWFISGPPFDGLMWSDVVSRMATHRHAAQVWTVLSEGGGSLREETDRLVSSIEQSTDAVVLVGHGTALPLVMAAANLSQVAGLVLSNGALGAPDMLSSALTRLAGLPKPIARTIFSPRVSLPILASSLGLRRVVVNPYVMDRDTTVAICGPVLMDPNRNSRALVYLSSLAAADFTTTDRQPTLLCWGDCDPLTSSNYLDFLESAPNNITVTPVEGGRYLHPIERPWAMADTISDWADTHLTTT